MEPALDVSALPLDRLDQGEFPTVSRLKINERDGLPVAGLTIDTKVQGSAASDRVDGQPPAQGKCLFHQGEQGLAPVISHARDAGLPKSESALADEGVAGNIYCVDERVGGLTVLLDPELTELKVLTVWGKPEILKGGDVPGHEMGRGEQQEPRQGLSHLSLLPVHYRKLFCRNEIQASIGAAWPPDPPGGECEGGLMASWIRFQPVLLSFVTSAAWVALGLGALMALPPRDFFVTVGGLLAGVATLLGQIKLVRLRLYRRSLELVFFSMFLLCAGAEVLRLWVLALSESAPALALAIFRAILALRLSGATASVASALYRAGWKYRHPGLLCVFLLGLGVLTSWSLPVNTNRLLEAGVFEVGEEGLFVSALVFFSCLGWLTRWLAWVEHPALLQLVEELLHGVVLGSWLAMMGTDAWWGSVVFLAAVYGLLRWRGREDERA